MNIQWPTPAQWSDFEEMCYRLSVSENRLSSPFRYGRKGQKQHGIDIGGMRLSSRTEWEGIQCKLKTEHLGGRLSPEELFSEIELAKKFPQSLVRLTFATTGPRDNVAQDAANQVNASASKSFHVDIWFWEDIIALLERHQDVARRFYPQLFPEVHVSYARDGTLESHFCAHQTSSDRVHRLKLVAEEPIFLSLGTIASKVLSVAVEFIENVLSPSKGKATRIAFEYDGTEMRLSDNGRPFNPLTNQPLSDEQQGLRSIQEFAGHGGVRMSYTERDEEVGRCVNVLTISLSSSLTLNASAATCVAYTDSFVLYDRISGLHVANQLEIREDCDPFVVRIGGARIVSRSAAHQFVDAVLQRVGTRKLHFVVAAHRDDLFDMLLSMSRHRGFDVLQD